jgi:hypothetical protein
MLPTKFRFIWPSGYRGEYFLEINQSEIRIACGGHVCFEECKVFLAHLAKGKVSFCHHLASVVCRLSSVNFSHFNLLRED